MVTEFIDVTDLSGDATSVEHLERVTHRYYWALDYCRNKDVVEVGCGCGQGLGLLSSVAHSLEAGDYSSRILSIAQTHYRGRIRLTVFNEQSLPFKDASKDIVIQFEALYHIRDAARFAGECRRVLRPGGRVLVATANKDLVGFYPSSLQHHYYGVPELAALFRGSGFEVEMFGYLPVRAVAWRRKALQPMKKLAQACGIHPKPNGGAWLLKHFARGDLVVMPAELPAPERPLIPPATLSSEAPDCLHRMLYCCATLRSGALAP